MSVKTFDSVRTPNVKNIRKALAGAVFIKRWAEGDAPITKVYTTAGGLIIPAGYTDVGVLSKSSAAKFARETNTSDVESFGYAQPTRRDITSDVTTVQFTMQESKRQVFELHGGVDLSAVKADTDGNIVIDNEYDRLGVGHRRGSACMGTGVSRIHHDSSFKIAPCRSGSVDWKGRAQRFEQLRFAEIITDQL